MYLFNAERKTRKLLISTFKSLVRLYERIGKQVYQLGGRHCVDYIECCPLYPVYIQASGNCNCNFVRVVSNKLAAYDYFHSGFYPVDQRTTWCL